jgi:hypothetical protein
MIALFLARRGVQGPLAVIEGINGIDGRLDHSLSDEIKHAAQSLETIQTRDLTRLLAAVPYPA